MTRSGLSHSTRLSIGPQMSHPTLLSKSRPVATCRAIRARPFVAFCPELFRTKPAVELPAVVMAVVVYNIIKAPMGWAVVCDGVKLGGIYGSKEAALEATTVAASFALRDGAGLQINAPDEEPFFGRAGPNYDA